MRGSQMHGSQQCSRWDRGPVEKSAGTKIAPFFRYPYLSDSPTTVAYLKSRNIA